MYRQGDILIIKQEIDEYDFSKCSVESSGVVAEGSITGHHHSIKNGVFYKKRKDWSGCIGYIRADKDCRLVHDEHGTIELPEGEYKVIKQREVSGDVED